MTAGKQDQPTFLHYRVFSFGSDEELVGAFGSLDAANEEWDRVSDEFLDRWNLWGMPQAWWRFEKDVPDHLRKGPALILTDAHADEWRALEMRRRRYLVSIGIDPAPERDRLPFGEA